MATLALTFGAPGSGNASHQSIQRTYALSLLFRFRYEAGVVIIVVTH